MTDQLVAVAQHLLNNKRIQRWYVIAKWSAEESTYRRAECRICGALGEDMAIATTVCNKGGWPSDSQKARFYGDIAIHANLHRKQYSDGMSGPHKSSEPAQAGDVLDPSVPLQQAGLGQPRAGGANGKSKAGPESEVYAHVEGESIPPASLVHSPGTEAPPAACPHVGDVRIQKTPAGGIMGFLCKDCGERVG